MDCPSRAGWAWIRVNEGGATGEKTRCWRMGAQGPWVCGACGGLTANLVRAAAVECGWEKQGWNSANSELWGFCCEGSSGWWQEKRRVRSARSLGGQGLGSSALMQGWPLSPGRKDIRVTGGMSSRDKQQTWAQMGQVGTAGGTWRSSADHFTSSEMWEETNPLAERRECLGAGGTGSVRPRERGPSIHMWQTRVRPPVHPAPLGGCEGWRVDLMGWGLARGT